MHHAVMNAHAVARDSQAGVKQDESTRRKLRTIFSRRRPERRAYLVATDAAVALALEGATRAALPGRAPGSVKPALPANKDLGNATTAAPEMTSRTARDSLTR